MGVQNRRFPAARWLGRTAVSLCALLCGIEAGAQRLSAADEAQLQRVDSHYNHLRSLRTEFTETYDGVGVHRVEAGELLLKKPGRMRWSYSEPKGKVFVLDGKYAFSYTPGDAQAQRSPAKELDDLRSPLRLLLGHTQLKREMKDVAVARRGDLVEIKGHPAVEQAGWKELTLRTSVEGVILALQLTGADGSTTAFAFRGEQDDLPVTAGDFVFTPPVGVPVVEGTPPI